MSQDDSDKPHDVELTESTEVGESPFGPGADIEVASSSSSTEHYQPPRMGIIHLLVWGMLAAIQMKLTAFFEMGIPAESREDGWLWAVQRSAYYTFSAVVSASLLGTFIIMRDKFRGAAGRLQPGHWVIVVYALQWSALMVINLIRMGLLGSLAWSNQTSSNLTWFFLYGAIALVGVVCFLAAAVRLRGGFRWRVLMLALSGNAFLSLLQWLGFGFEWYSLITFRDVVKLIVLAAVLLILMVAVCIDCVRRCRRDGLHWLGVAIVVASAVTNIAFTILSKIARYHS